LLNRAHRLLSMATLETNDTVDIGSRIDLTSLGRDLDRLTLAAEPSDAFAPKDDVAPPPSVPLPAPSSQLVREIKESGWSIFRPLADLGYFTWRPSSRRHKSLRDVSAEEVRQQVDLQALPDRLVDVYRLPLPVPFLTDNNSKCTYVNKYPLGQFDVAGLYAAARRGLRFHHEKIDFCLGGSTLNMLATRDDSSPYFACMIAGTKTILVSKQKEYVRNLSDVGFQFERLVTGRAMNDWNVTTVVNGNASVASHNLECLEHLHVMQVGSYRVLFRAETDAVDEENNPVEIKASHPRYWKKATMLQMLSSGSTTLCRGVKGRGSLSSVNTQSLVQVSAKALGDRSSGTREALERLILEGMAALREQLQCAGKVYKIVFPLASVGGRNSHGGLPGKLRLIPAIGRRAIVLPSDKVLRELLAVPTLLTKP
jgi:hypothetical protein